MNVKIENAKKSLTAEGLQKAEEVIGVTLPEEYKRFLMMHNGGYPEPADFEILWKENGEVKERMISNISWFMAIYDGDASNLLKKFESLKGRIPEDTIAIAIDPGGNYIVLGITGQNKGKVFFWMLDYEDHTGETANESNVGFVANSFNEFFDSLCEFKFEEDDE